MRRFSSYLCVFAAVLVCSSYTHAQTKYSLVVGVDGLGAYGLQTANTQFLDSLIDGTFGGGAYNGALAQHSFVGGNVGTATQQVTSSGPGWSSNLTGVWKDKHGVTDNSFGGSNFGANPSYLETLEANVASVYSASAITWSPIDSNVISTVAAMDFRATGSDAANTTTAVSQIAGMSSSNPGALFVHLDDVDGDGHGSGAYSTNYLNEIAEVDSQIGSMLTAIQNRTNFANEDWQIVITADHGHRPGGGHGGQFAMERTIPIIVSSKSAAQGFIPTSGGHATSIVDVAPTVLNHFGISQPANYAGQAIGQSALSINTQSLVQNGLVSHMSLDGDASAGLAGSGGTITNNANGGVQFVQGKFGQAAAVVNYGDGFIRLNDDLDAQIGSGDFSMSLWMKYDSFTGDPAFLSNKDWVSGTNTGINLAFNPSDTLDFNTQGGAGSRLDAHPLEVMNPGIWQNYVFTVDRDGLTNVFVDGTLVGAIQSTSAGSFDTAFNWVLLNDGTGNYAGSVNGLMVDEFAAWDRLLTLDEVTVLSQTAVPEPGGLAILSLVLSIMAVRRRRNYVCAT